MKKTVLLGLCLSAFVSSTFAARVADQSTDSYGDTLYTIECNNGSWSSVSRAGNSYSSAKNGSGRVRSFNSLGAAAAYTCGE